MLPEEDEEAANLLILSLLLALATSAATVPVVLFAGGPISRWLKAPALEGILWGVPPSVFLFGALLALNYWNSRTRRFARLSAVRVAASATSTAVQLGAAAAGYATGGSLVASSIAGSSVSVAVLGGQIFRDDRALIRRSVRWRRLRDGLARHRKFPVYDAGSTLLNSISWQLPAFLLQYYFSAAVVGFYSLGNQVLRVPMSLIGGAIGQVFYQRAADARRAGTLAEVVESAFRRLVAYSLFPLALIAIAGGEMFAAIFGSRWAEAGVYAQILAPWTFFWFLSSPLSSLFSVLENQEFSLKLNVVIFASRFLSLAAGGILRDARLALILFSATGVLVYAYYTFAVLRASEVEVGRLTRFLGARLAELLPAAAAVIVLKSFGVGIWVVCLAAVALLAIPAVRTLRKDEVVVGLIRSVLPTRGRS
jgi:O-antigen/teichoic acid export membrane protein